MFKHKLTFRSAVIGIGLINLAYLLLSLLFKGRAEWHTPVSDIMLLAINLLAAASLAYAAWNCQMQDRAVCKAWLMLAAGQGVYVLGDLTFMLLNHLMGEAPFPSIADWFYLAYYPVFAFGLLLLPASPLNRDQRRNTMLDIAIVMLSAALLTLNFLIMPLARESEYSFIQMVFSIAYPALDLVLFFVLTQLLFRRSQNAAPTLFFLQAGVMVAIAADVLYILGSYNGDYSSGNLADILYALSYSLTGLAGMLQATLNQAAQPIVMPRQTRRALDLMLNWIVYSPYLWGFLAFLVLVFQNQVSTLPRIVLAAFVGGILILVMVRQILALQGNALLYQSETKRRQLAESLTRATHEMTSTLDFQQVPGLILDQLAVVVPYQRCSIMLEQNKHLYIAAQRGFPEENEHRTQEVLIALRDGDPYLLMANTLEPVIIEDVTRIPGWTILPWLPLNKSWMGAPLIVRDKTVGMISITRQEAGAFTTEDMLLAKAFAGQAAVTLENARLYAELQRAYRTLEILDKSKSNFIEIVAHELRTPLTIIKGYTQTLASQPTVQDDPQNQTLLDGVVRGADRMHEIVNNMIDITKIDTQVLVPHKVTFRLVDLFQRIARYYEPALIDRKLSLEMGDLSQLPLIQADSELLQKVFLQLVMNAIKYTPDGGKITISGRVDHNAKLIEIVIADTGIGIAPDQIDLIFEKFYQTGQASLHSTGQTKFKGGGPGLGLPIARGIITAHGGKIWADSPGIDEKACPGSKFHVQLPI